MNMLQRISIKNFLFCIVGLLVAVLTLQSTGSLLRTSAVSHEIERISLANNLSDLIITAAGFEAIERGVTSAALSQKSASDSLSYKNKIDQLREKGALALDSAFAITATLLKTDSSNTALKSAADKALKAHASLLASRVRVDNELSKNRKNLTTTEWIKSITAFIDANANLRLAAMTSPATDSTLQEALRLNLELKQAVWLSSEYAGRERATLAGYISSKTGLDTGVKEKLNAYRAIVELNIAPILALKQLSGIDPAITESINKMERNFIGNFGNVRQSVYAAAGSGNYPITASQWLKLSTSAIDSILDVSGAIGTMVDNLIAVKLAASNTKKITSIVSLVSVLALGLFAFWVIKSKIIRPMLALNSSMGYIEKTGDLTTKLKVHSDDEIGQVSKSFNTMLGMFHNIVTDIHLSADKLVASSEELSASSVQIASGTREQSDKALQVSAASQEMSATIIEITQSISNASETAEAASTVASSGGRTVDETIHSMREISESAQASSEIITALGVKSEQIGDIIEVINDIADQTNLLALNAAIEAARAGEQGRGFAVVADEVRKLAEKTMTATKEIGDMINGMQQETNKAITSAENEVKIVESGVSLASEAGESLTEILDKVNVVSSMVQQVSIAAIEQTATTEQITTDIEGISTVINDTSSSAEQVAGASHEIAELANGLKDKISMFKVTSANDSTVLHLPGTVKAGNRPTPLPKAQGF